MISIHALRKESDLFRKIIGRRLVISIHALRKESDLRRTTSAASAIISIHALRKESDLTLKNLSFGNRIFQSTLSVRRATLPVLVSTAIVVISIHALRKESDGKLPANRPCRSNFNPRSP